MDILKRLKISKRFMIVGGVMAGLGFVSAVLHDAGYFDHLNKEQLGAVGLITGMIVGAGTAMFTTGALNRLEIGKIDEIIEF